MRSGQPDGVKLLGQRSLTHKGGKRSARIRLRLLASRQSGARVGWHG